MKNFQKIFFLIFILFFSYAFTQEKKQDNSSANIDGPYIFHRDGKIISKQIMKENGVLTPKIKEISSENQKIRCFIDEKKFFEVELKKKLENNPTYYKKPKKIIAISDIEGNFEPLKNFLIQNQVMDKNFNWTFGKGHLVLNGDFFDRGLIVTQCLWLIYHLENQAEKKGGKVHFILGNHEMMNLYGNEKYVRNQYFENAKLLNEEYKNFYTLDTELGKWLQTKNVVEKIGDYLFVHAGLSKEVADLNLSLEEINEFSRPHYFNSYHIRNSENKTLQILFSGKVSPFWYRDLAKEIAPKEDLDKILAQYSAKRMIIGHTLSPEIKYLYNKKLINIDTDHAKGNTQGLLIKNRKEYRVNLSGNKTRLK